MSLFEKKKYNTLLGGYMPFERPEYDFSLPVTKTSETFSPPVDNRNNYKKLFDTSQYKENVFKRESSDRLNHLEPDKPLSDMSLDELQQARKQNDWVSRNIGGVFGFGKKGVEINKNPGNVVQSIIGMEFPPLGIASSLIGFVADKRLEEIDTELAHRMDQQSVKKDYKKHHSASFNTSNSQSSRSHSKPKQKTSRPVWMKPIGEPEYNSYGGFHGGDRDRNSGGSRGGYQPDSGWSERSKGSKDKGRGW